MYNYKDMEEKISNLSDYKAEIEKNNVIAIIPKGNSMWPTLKNKKQTVVVKAKKERLKKFDVALYVRGQNMFVLHRVMEVLPDGYIMCGDSQFDLEKVLEEQIFGIMIGFYRGKKYIDCDFIKYNKKIERWYKRKNLRKIRIKLFYLKEAFKRKIKKVFWRNKNV